jgi:hypothetical protein
LALQLANTKKCKAAENTVVLSFFEAGDTRFNMETVFSYYKEEVRTKIQFMINKLHLLYHDIYKKAI